MENINFSEMTYDDMGGIVDEIHNGCIREIKEALSKCKGKKVIVEVYIYICHKDFLGIHCMWYDKGLDAVLMETENGDVYNLTEVLPIDLIDVLKYVNIGIDEKNFAHPKITIDNLTEKINALPLGGTIEFAEEEDCDGTLEHWNSVKHINDEKGKPMFVFDHCGDGTCYVAHDKVLNYWLVKEALEAVTSDGTSYNADDVVYLEN